MKYWKLFCLSTLSLCLTVGCGDSAGSDQPDLGTVSGVVTMDGKPLPAVTVTFTPTEGRPSEWRYRRGRTLRAGVFTRHTRCCHWDTQGQYFHTAGRTDSAGTDL
ncbi:MAG: hypothetical protein NXI29_12120 [bacterium]|nr:hypothetical protein [bacterium]